MGFIILDDVYEGTIYDATHYDIHGTMSVHEIDAF